MIDSSNLIDLPLNLLDLEDSSLLPLYKEHGTNIISLNLEQVVLAYENPEFKKLIQEAEIVIPDGEAVCLGYKFLYGKKISKLAGIDLAEKLLKEKNRVAILGSTQKVIESLKKSFTEKIVFMHHGFIELNQMDEIAKKISSSKPELLLVGMGAPKQEIFIKNYKIFFPNCLCMGVGGALDVFAGVRSRAPKLFIDLKLEWLFRIFQEPFRLKRILYKLPRFFSLLIFAKFKKS